MNNKFLVAAALVVCVAVASAQTGQGNRQGGRQGGRAGMFGQAGRGAGEMQLVFRADVQADLGLTADQKTKLTALQAKQREARRGSVGNSGRTGNGGAGTVGGAGTTGGAGNNGGQGSVGGRRGNRGAGGQGANMTDAEREAMRKRMQEQRDASRKELAAILSEAQMKRLDEIQFQLQGTRAIMREENQKALGLTTEQILKVTDLQQKQQQANQALMEKMRNQELTREDLQKSRENNEKILDAELMKILTADQQAKFKAMQGKPFKADPAATGRGGNRGG